MKILITGGAGYIGTELTYLLASDPKVEQIIVYDNLSRGNRNLFIGKDKLPRNKVSFIQGDILDSRRFRKALQGVDVVYHLAANVTTPFSDQNPHLFEQVNNWGTAELIYEIEESDVKSLIYLSSVSVYGAGEEMKTIESEPDPKTFYGISKLRGEAHVKRLFNKMNTVIVRCGNVYGYSKSMRFDAVVNRFLFEANFQKLITVNGTGKQTRAFIHVEKAALALSKMHSNALESGVYNLVERNLAIGEIVEVLRKQIPELEMLFVNQHMPMREMKVQADKKINALFNELNSSLEEEIADFREKFSFG